MAAGINNIVVGINSGSGNVECGGITTANSGFLVTDSGGVPSISSSVPGATFTGAVILNADPVTALGAVTKQYADAISAGLAFKASCYAATTATLNAIYLNGAAGVGATLTNAGSLVAFAVDGTTPPINSRILVKNQSTPAQNGAYSLTVVGDGATPWVLTRTTDYNTTAEIVPGTLFVVDNGTVNGTTSWLETATVTTIGTDAITFSQFTFANPITSVTGTSNRITSTGGTTPVIDISASYVGQSSLTTLGTITTGTWTGTNIALANGGTNAALTASNGGIVYSGASGMAILTATATGNQLLLSGASGAPAWSTATHPATTVANNLLYSSATNVIANLATQNNGVLVTDGSSVPSIGTTLPTQVQGNITSTGTITSGTWNGTTIAVANGGTGITASNPIVQIVRANTTSVITCNGAITLNDTIPQISSGVEIITVTITPKNSNNILTIEFYGSGEVSGATTGSVCLFQDSTANALSASVATACAGAAYVVQGYLKYSMTAGTTSATTFKIRGGTTNGTWYVNGVSGGTRLFGGVSQAVITITETTS